MSLTILKVNRARFAFMLLAATAMAQTSASASAAAPLAVEAQEAINKGIIAAKNQDYLLSIQYFQAARKIAPDAPEIYYDLGLAESKLPGRQLRAVAWFGAYLAANPTAANAAAMTKATASSTRLPRITKSLKPFILPPGRAVLAGTPIM